MMGIARSSVVCFVIDTTGSMSDDIAEARKVVHDIIDSKKGTQDEPSEYILVPFNDPRKTFLSTPRRLHNAAFHLFRLKFLLLYRCRETPVLWEGKMICWFVPVL